MVFVHAKNSVRLFIGFLLPKFLIVLLTIIASEAVAIPKSLIQIIAVNGTVKDEKGEPLPGVSVRLIGSKTGATTDLNGNFKINVPDQSGVLEFSFLGFQTETVKIGSQTTLNIILKGNATSLNEVVVVGYGTQRRSDILGAVSSFDVKRIEEKPITRIEQALIGQMPGVQVRQQSGIPGAGLSILVRGSGSITAGNEPLYVIDGFPLDVASQNSNGTFTENPLNNISPNDIESIQVLKDAAAGAIYGSRAANGVVIITTKRGKAGKVNISFNANTGQSQVVRKVDVLSPEEWVQVATEVANASWVRSGTGRTASQTNAERRAILGLAANDYNISFMPDERWSIPGHPGLTYIDWQDEVYRKALFQNYQLSASGATENVNYFISGNYLNNQGTLIQTDLKSYGLRANVEARASKKLKFGINLSPSYSENNAANAEGKDNILMDMATLTPVVESAAGINTNAGDFSNYNWATARVASPVASLNHITNLIKTTRILSSIYGEFEVLPGLKVKSTINYDDFGVNTKRYNSDYIAGSAAERLTNPGKNASGSYNVSKKQNFLNENTLSFDRNFSKDHHLSLLGGVSYNYVHREVSNLSTAGGFANNIVTTINNAIPNSSGVTVNGNTTESNNTLFSLYSRIQYGFKDRYLISGTIRRDASSKFGKENQWGTFPSASIGWRVSQEPFFENVKIISDLKFRLSWGKSGNNNIGDYNSMPYFRSNNYSFGGSTPIIANGQVLSGPANPALKWETSNTYNIGVDLSVLKNRITFIADAYTRKSTDLLLNLPVLASSGFNTSLSNIGKVSNKGIELGLNSSNIVKRKWSWSTSANIAFNNNKVLSLRGDNAPIYIPSAYSSSVTPYILQPGLPMYSFYVTKVVGILSAEDIADPKVAKLANQTVGDAKFFDADNNGVINGNDRVVGGRPTPKYTWGITNTFKYGHFDLSAHIYGQQGGQLLSYFGRAIDFSGSTSANVLGLWRDRWTVDNQNYTAVRGKLGSNYDSPQVTSDWIYSSDFWRVQNITLGYNLKGALKTKAFNAARIYVSLQNWFGKDKYYGGANPEAQNTNTSGDASFPVPGDYGSMPLSKTATFGVNFSF